VKLGYVFLSAFIVSFGIVLFGEAGLLSAYKQSQENAKLTNRIQVLEGENARLMRDIDAVEKSARRLEHTIRTTLSLVAPDEILFEFQ
jgi:cell division protein FtsB